jgi:hypothetical protein
MISESQPTPSPPAHESSPKRLEAATDAPRVSPKDWGGKGSGEIEDVRVVETEEPGEALRSVAAVHDELAQPLADELAQPLADELAQPSQDAGFQVSAFSEPIECQTGRQLSGLETSGPMAGNESVRTPEKKGKKAKRGLQTMGQMSAWSMLACFGWGLQVGWSLAKNPSRLYEACLREDVSGVREALKYPSHSLMDSFAAFAAVQKGSLKCLRALPRSHVCVSVQGFSPLEMAVAML